MSEPLPIDLDVFAGDAVPDGIALTAYYVVSEAVANAVKHADAGRIGLRIGQDAGHEVVAKAADASSLLAAVHAAQPDLAIVDIRMPPDRTDDSARAARTLRTSFPLLGIVLLSQHR